MRIWAISKDRSLVHCKRSKGYVKMLHLIIVVFIFLSLLNMKEIGGTSITSYFQGIPRDGMKWTT